MKRIALLTLMVLVSITSFAQKKVLIENKEEIHAEAIREIEQAMAAPEGSIYLFATSWGMKGEYKYDITIREKGDVATVFSHGNTNGTIENQNRMKDFLMTLDFDFKMPKGKYYKFTYTFKF